MDLKVVISHFKFVVKTEDIHPPKTGISVHFCVPSLVKSEQSHPLGDGKKPFTGGQK